MREACLYNNWNFVPIFLKIYRPLIRWTPWSFLWGGGGDESPRWGHSPRMRSGGSGDGGSLPSSFGWESILFIKTHFIRGDSLHISWWCTHLLHIYFLFSWWRHQMGTGFCAGNSPVTAGIHRSSVNYLHTDQWRGALMFSLNKRLSKQSRRRWFETPSRSLGRHCDVVPNNDPVIRAAVRYFGVQRVTLVQFWIGETGQVCVCVCGGGGGGGGSCIMEGMASNLAHCSTLITIPWN